MNSKKNKMIEAFDNAECYDQNAKVQKIVIKRFISFIKKNYIQQTQPMTILEIGCGTGNLTHELTQLFPNAKFVITDISATMVERAKKKFETSDCDMTFAVMDGEDPNAYGSFDLICSSLTFQWFADLSKSLDKLTSLLKPNGYLFCTTLTKESFTEWREIYHKLDISCPFRFYPDIQELNSTWPTSEGHGFWEDEDIIDSSINGLEFIRNLRNIGAHQPSETHTALTPGQLRKAIRAFEEKYNYTTYEIAYGCYRKYASKGFFVTGTDTDIGKTFVSTCLTMALNAVYWKPLQTGLNCDPGDTKAVIELGHIREENVLRPLVELQMPLSPEEAAKQEEISIDIDKLDFPTLESDKTYIVEGAGGVMVPITTDQFILQLIKKINLPVIVVASTKLGTINHTLLTIEVLKKYHIPIAGVILNGALNVENKEAIEHHSKIRVISQIPIMSSILNEFISQFKNDLERNH